MTGIRTRFGADFKAKVALEAIRGELRMSQLATKLGVHQTMINDWERMAIAGLALIFDGKGVEKEVAQEGEVEKLHAKIGQLDRVPLCGVTAACRSSVPLVGRADQIPIAGKPMARSSLMPAMVSRVMYRPR